MSNGFINFIIRNYIPIQNNKIYRNFGSKPLPVDFWMQKKDCYKHFSMKPDILIPSGRFLRSKGENIPVKDLQKVLSGAVIGNWTLDRKSIAILWEKLQVIKPKIIIEAGSGISTLIFSEYMQNNYPGGKVISLEQDENEKNRVEGLLSENNLSSFVEILYAPINKAGHYSINEDNLKSALGEKKADWLMIDGPCGEEGSREYVLDDLLHYMNNGAAWFADDAFRDGELGFLKKWESRKDIEVMGIHPVGKGLAEGRII
ncbi:MAG: hypothetical protein EPN39_10230 [Chitinophagaceae bacterium]|nr:MAG: hypothetical protein EPN39_10230 [Chitinophagaceae bacterium]